MSRLLAWAVRAGRGRWLALLLLATVTLPVALHQYSPFERARIALFDLYQVVLPRARLSAPVTIVAVDEAALRKIGQWPWPRTYLAELIDRIGEQGALAIGLDIILPERDQTSPESLAERIEPGHESVRVALAAMPAYDALFSQTLKRYRVVLGASGVETAANSTSTESLAPMVVTRGGEIPPRVRQYPHVLQSMTDFRDAASGQGMLNVHLEHGVVRRMPMISSVRGTLIPAFALELLRVATGTRTIEIESRNGNLKAVNVGDLRVPTLPNGEVWLHFGALDSGRYVSAVDVLGKKINADSIKAHIVIVAVTATGVDVKATPLGESVSGPEAHAQLIESIFDGRFLHRPAWMPWAEVAILLSLGGVLIWVAPSLRRDPAILLAFGVLLFVLALGFGLFHWRGLLFDALTIVIALTTVFSSLIASALVRADQARRATEHSLHLEREVSARVSGELEAARRIQLGILPQAKLSFPDEKRFELAAALEPARAVGGDLYDFFMLDANRLFVIVADVSGKGVPASLLMAITKALTKSIALRAGDDTARVLTQANIEVSRDNPESQFVTAFAAVLEVNTGVLRYWTAGHDTPFLREGNQARQIDRSLSGPPLCVLDGFDYREQQIGLRPGDALILFTDGITEAEDTNGKHFGKEHLERCLSDLPRVTSAADILEGLRTEISAFVGEAQPSDDLTLMVVRWLGPSPINAP